MARVIGVTRSVIRRTEVWRRRWGILSSVALIASAGVAIVLAVHDTGRFQLDGDAATATSAITPPPNFPVGSDDWDKVCNEATNGGAAGCGTTLDTTGANAVAWTTDNLIGNGPSLNATIFTGGGSKDPSDVSSWAWKDGAGGLPDKDNLTHAFAVRYSLTATDPATNPLAPCPNGTGGPTEPTFNPLKPCDILLFGSNRIDNSGDAQQGFWFLQNKVSVGVDTNGDGTLDGPCPQSIGGGTGFCDPDTGAPATHLAGDLLVISDFSNGGSTSTITIYSWDPTCLKEDISKGGSCGDANLRRLRNLSGANANCATAGSADIACGLVNPATVSMPWPFADKSGTINNGALNGEFFEAGLNLSVLNLQAECFATIASETRSSTSTTAVLKDFVLGTFGRCTSGLKTTPKLADGSAIPSDLSVGTQGFVDVKDLAELTIGNAASWTGNLKFWLCGPTLLSSPYAPCTTGGTQIGPVAGVTVDNTTPTPIYSAIARVTSAGKYCWRAEFDSQTNGVPDAQDASEGECFTVLPITPTIITKSEQTVTIGSSISDTATLGNVAFRPADPVVGPASPPPTQAGAGGSITFKAYSTSDCSGDPVFTDSRTVTGGGDYTVTFTPTSAGTYKWIATYSGDLPNTVGPGTGGSVSGSCGDSGETDVVNPVTPTLVTVATAAPEGGAPLGTTINDTATLSGTTAKPNGLPAGGTITFTLYGPVATNTPTCSAVVGSSVVNVSGDGNYVAGTGTVTGTFKPTAPGYYFWRAVYSGDSPNTNGVNTPCGDTNETSYLVQLQPTIATAQTMTLKDSATISITDSGAGNLAGTVRFRLYNNATCDTTSPNLLIYDSRSQHPQDIAVSGSGNFPQSVTVFSDVVTFTTTQPVLSWLVEYTSTNQGQKNATSSCNTERANLTIVNQ